MSKEQEHSLHGGYEALEACTSVKLFLHTAYVFLPIAPFFLLRDRLKLTNAALFSAIVTSMKIYALFASIELVSYNGLCVRTGRKTRHLTDFTI